MVSRKTPSVLAENESEYLGNFELDEYQRALRRPGFVRLHNPEPWQTNQERIVGGPYFFYDRNGVPHLLVVTTDTGTNCSLYDFDWAFSQFYLVGELALNDLNDLFRVTFVPFGDDIIIIHQDLDPPRRFHPLDPFPGTIDSLGGIPPRAKTGAIYYNHLFLADADNPVRVFYSATNDPDNGYGGTNFLFDVVAGGDVSAVTSFLPLERELIIGKEASVTSLSGSTPNDFSQPQNQASYTGERGPLAPHCLTEIEGRPWFLSRDGIWSITGPYALREESYNVDSYFDTVLGSEKGPESLLYYDVDRKTVIAFMPNLVVGLRISSILTGYPGFGRDGLAAWTELFTDAPGPTSSPFFELFIRGVSAVKGYRFVAARFFNEDEPTGGTDGVYMQGGGAFLSGQALRLSFSGYDDVDTPVRALYRSQRIPYSESRSNVKLLRTVGVEVERNVETTATVQAICDAGAEEEVRSLTFPTPF